MDWIHENWFWVVVGVLFLWLHGRMHGGHGHAGHGGGCGGGHGHGRGENEPSERKEASHGGHRTQGDRGREPAPSGGQGHAEH